MSNLSWGLAVSIVLAAGAVSAEEQSISTVRQAAIEKLQTKLGTLRGSINRDSHNIFLTSGMIAKLKPINLGDYIANNEIVGRELNSRSSDVVTLPPVKKQSSDQLINSAGFTTDEQS